MNIIKLLRRQAQLYYDKLMDRLTQSNTKNDIYRAHSSTLSEFYNHAFKPTLEDAKVREFKREQIQDIVDSTKADIDVAYEQLEDISLRLQDAYNTNQDYKTSVRNRVQYLTSIVSDLNIMSGQSDDSYVMFKDSLTNYDFIDKNFSSGTSADISTAEGIAHLHVTSDKLVSKDGPEVKINGNGIEGNYHVIKKVNIETINPQYDIYAKYQSDEDPRDNVTAIVDDQPNTWFEYEKVGISDYYKARYYDVEWAEADKMHDELVLKIDIKLKNVEEINWIDISPYLPEKARSAVKVYSIRVSQDGSEFSPVYKDREIIDKEIHLIPQRYLDDTLFNNDTIAKFASQGIFSFPQIKAKFIEIILKQDKPYDEFVGITYYETISTTANDEEISRQLVSWQQVPVNIVNGPIGKYKV